MFISCLERVNPHLNVSWKIIQQTQRLLKAFKESDSTLFTYNRLVLPWKTDINENGPSDPVLTHLKHCVYCVPKIFILNLFFKLQIIQKA